MFSFSALPRTVLAHVFATTLSRSFGVCLTAFAGVRQLFCNACLSVSGVVLPTPPLIAGSAKSHGPPVPRLDVGILRRVFVSLRTVCLFGVVALCSSFSVSVVGVVGGSAQEKMVGPNTTRIVTVMAYKQPTWSLAVDQFPCESVGVDDLAANLKVTITPLMMGRSRPLPAVARLVNPFPKPLFYGFHTVSLTELQAVAKMGRLA